MLRSVGTIAGAAFGAGVLSLVFHAWAGRTLTVEEFARLGIVWTCLAVLSQTVGAGLEQWTSREATVGHVTSPLVLAVTVIVMSVAAGGAVRLLVGGVRWPTIALLGGAGLGLLHWRKGMLVGAGRTGRTAAVFAVETVARLSLVGLVGFGWAIPAGSAAGLAVAAGRTDLRPARRRCGAGMFVLEASTAGAGYQLWLGGAPLLVWAIGGTPQDVSTVFLLFLLAKAPLTLLFALQGTLVSALTRGDRRTAKVMNRMLGWAPTAGAVTGAGLCGAWLLPPAVDLITGGRVNPLMAGLVAGGVVACGMVQILGQHPVARGTPLIVGKAWLLAGGVGAAAGAAVLPLGVLWAVAVGFAVGCAAAAGRTVLRDTFRTAQPLP